MDHITLTKLQNKYAILCAKNSWSPKSATQFFDVTKDRNELCVASCEISAAVGVGRHIAPEIHLCESDNPSCFTAYKSIVYLKTNFTQGVEEFDRAEEYFQLDRQAREAAQTMEQLYMVSWSWKNARWLMFTFPH